MNMETCQSHTVEAVGIGEQLAQTRMKKGYTQEYVASKLNLRVKIITSLEDEDFNALAGPVFVKGYLQAYAKLLGIDPQPLLDKYQILPIPEKKVEKILWQQQKSSYSLEYFSRWIITFFVLLILVLSFWWHQSRNHPTKVAELAAVENSLNKEKLDYHLSDLSKINSILLPPSANEVRERPVEH